MLLSDEDIKIAVKNGVLMIKPFKEELVNPAGYDLRCGESIIIKSKEYCLTYTLEWIELPLNIAGILHLRSSLTREGLIGGLALVDPGFKGQLTIALFNSNVEPINLSKSESFLQISFNTLTKSAFKGYQGHYQVSLGAVPSRRGLEVKE